MIRRAFIPLAGVAVDNHNTGSWIASLKAVSYTFLWLVFNYSQPKITHYWRERQPLRLLKLLVKRPNVHTSACPGNRSRSLFIAPKDKWHLSLMNLLYGVAPVFLWSWNLPCLMAICAQFVYWGNNWFVTHMASVSLRASVMGFNKTKLPKKANLWHCCQSSGTTACLLPEGRPPFQESACFLGQTGLSCTKNAPPTDQSQSIAKQNFFWFSHYCFAPSPIKGNWVVWLADIRHDD